MTMETVAKSDEDAEIYRKMQKDPLFFVLVMYNLRPQKVRDEYRDQLLACRREQEYSEMRLGMFEEYVKGEMITRQQYEILLSIKRAIT